MSTLTNQLFVALLVILIVSYGTGLILGGVQKADKILSWELKKLLEIVLWIMKQVFQTIANIFSYLAKQCDGKKPKKKPT